MSRTRPHRTVVLLTVAVAAARFAGAGSAPTAVQPAEKPPAPPAYSGVSAYTLVSQGKPYGGLDGLGPQWHRDTEGFLAGRGPHTFLASRKAFGDSDFRVRIAMACGLGSAEDAAASLEFGAGNRLSLDPARKRILSSGPAFGQDVPWSPLPESVAEGRPFDLQMDRTEGRVRLLIDHHLMGTWTYGGPLGQVALRAGTAGVRIRGFRIEVMHPPIFTDRPILDRAVPIMPGQVIRDR